MYSKTFLKKIKTGKDQLKKLKKKKKKTKMTKLKIKRRK